MVKFSVLREPQRRKGESIGNSSMILMHGAGNQRLAAAYSTSIIYNRVCVLRGCNQLLKGNARGSHILFSL